MKIRHPTKFNFSINFSLIFVNNELEFRVKFEFDISATCFKKFKQLLLLPLSHLDFFSQDGMIKANDFCLNN